MSRDILTVSTKEELINYIKDIPDGALIIIPAWHVHGQIRCATKKLPNPSIDIRLYYATDLIQESDKDIRNLQKIKIIPICFVNKEDISQIITQKGIELFKNA